MNKETYNLAKMEAHAAHALKVARNADTRKANNLAAGQAIPPAMAQGQAMPNRRTKRSWGMRKRVKAGYRWRNGGGNVALGNEQKPWKPTTPEA